MPKHNHVREIVKKAGGAAVVGRRLNISSQAVSQWRRVPAEHVPELSEMSGLHPHEIRPDVFREAA